jgi:hypothetical protein
MQTNQPAGQDASSSMPTVTAGTTRRAWLRSGVVVATPVVASLVSPPVHAAGACVLPSGFVSATTFLSRHPGASTCVGNRGPNFWYSQVGSWPAPATDATFANVFGGFESGMDNTTKLSQVLGGVYSNFTKFIVAAYLNAIVGTPSFPLDPAQSVGLWTHFHGGASSPLLLPGWTEATTEAWLRTLMDP